jgi:NADPH:quinone reductase-like Zn-dependent oxidoreductase
MKAYYSTAYGGPEVSSFGDFPDPVPGAGMLLVEVKAVSINPVDVKVKRGDLKLLTGSAFPRIYGSDFSGIVKDPGKDETKFRAGDRIYGVTPVILRRPGALAELLAAEKRNIMKIPQEMSFEEAAALPTAALTAFNGLRNCRINEGKQLLINGATGGVGHFAIQIARVKGAIVTASCSPENAGLAKKLGASETIGYSSDDLKKIIGKFDAILDAYGKMPFDDIRRLLKRGGIYASTMVKPQRFFSSMWVQLGYGIKLTSSNMRSKPEDIQEMETLFLEKKLYPVIENVFPLNQAEKAFELAEHGKHRGKIVVTI